MHCWETRGLVKLQDNVKSELLEDLKFLYQ